MNLVNCEPLALRIGKFFLAFSCLERNLRFKANNILAREGIHYDEAERLIQKMPFSELFFKVKIELTDEYIKAISELKMTRNLLAHGRIGYDRANESFQFMNMSGSAITSYSLCELDALTTKTIKYSNLEYK